MLLILITYIPRCSQNLRVRCLSRLHANRVEEALQKMRRFQPAANTVILYVSKEIPRCILQEVLTVFADLIDELGILKFSL